MTFRMTKYAGEEKEYEGKYALEYGPILMAYVSLSGQAEKISLNVSPDKLLRTLKPVQGKPLHFSTGTNDFEYMPYFEIQDESFSCYP